MRNGMDFEKLYEELINNPNAAIIVNDGNEYIQKRKLLMDRQALEMKHLNQKQQLQLLALKRKNSIKSNAVRKKHSNQLRNFNLKSS